MEKPVDRITITYDPETASFNVQGIALGPVKCIGMLEYALMCVKRQDAMLQAAMAAEAQRKVISIVGRG